MSQRARLSRILVLILICITGVFTAPLGHAYTKEMSTWRDSDGIGVGLPVTSIGDGPPIAPRHASALDSASLSNMRPAAAPRIALISSGVDKTVFPTSLSSRITTLGSSADPIGYGTYAASVLLQLNEATTIVSLGSYPAGVFSADTFNLNLAYVINNASAFDAVLIDIPPTDFLDPVSSAMQAGAWDDVLDSIADAPLKTSNGTVYGIAMDDSLFGAQTISYHNSLVLTAFRNLMRFWSTATGYIKTINSLGLSVVMPSGDLGPGPQTIFGLSNLAEVITVGGFNPGPTGTVSVASGAGPSIDLKVKPDLLAATGIMGLLPPDSTLANYLRSKSILNDSLTPAWSATDPSIVTPAKALLDTTLTSAVIVAAAAGGIATGVNGVRDASRQRGAIYRRSEPIAGIPVWRQGQGVLGTVSLTTKVPDALFASSAPMALSHLDLGLEPSSGTWSASTTVTQGTPTTATVSYKDFIGVDIFGHSSTTSATSAISPPISVTTETSLVKVTVPLGNDDLEAGVYCGYVPTTLTSSSTSTVVEQIAYCDTNGFKPVARSFEIHDRSAVTETFELAPALPPGVNILEMPLHFLPMNPVGATLFTKTTSSDTCSRYGVGAAPPTSTASFTTCLGHAHFDVVPPGYYMVRARSDYGAPISSVTTSTASPSVTITHTADIGAPLGYSTFKTLLLPRPANCVETYDAYDDWSETTTVAGWPKSWKQCTAAEVIQRIEVPGATATATAVEDKATGGWFILPQLSGGPDPIRVNLGFLRKSLDAAVASRYIDIVHPCKELQFASLRTPQLLSIDAIIKASTGTVGWSAGCNNLESLVAQLSSAGDSTGQVGSGVAAYPFKMTTPNYSAHMSLNFSYEVNNAFIIVLVVAGGEVNLGMVKPDGVVVKLAPQGPDGTIKVPTATARGYGDGKATIDWKFLPRGVSSGTVYFTFVPVQSYETSPLQSVASWAKIKDNELLKDTLSFELDTQMTVAWPAINFKHRVDDPLSPCKNYAISEGLHGNDCGHSFRVQSNFSPWTHDASGTYTGGQIKGECRDFEGSTESAHVCEEWNVLAQSPNPDVTTGASVTENAFSQASLMDVIDTSSWTYTSLTTDLVNYGGGLYAPPLPRLQSATSTIGLPPELNEAAATSTSLLEGVLQTNGNYFEQILFPTSFLQLHPNELEVCINDGLHRTTNDSDCGGSLVGGTWIPTVAATTALTRYSPAVPQLGAYIPYVSKSSFLQ